MKAEIYEDPYTLWRWRVKAKNGSVLARSGKGYMRRADCARAYYRFRGWIIGNSPAMTIAWYRRKGKRK